MQDHHHDHHVCPDPTCQETPACESFWDGVRLAQNETIQALLDVRDKGIEHLPERARPCKDNTCDHGSCALIWTLDYLYRLAKHETNRLNAEKWETQNPRLTDDLRDVLGSV